ncbi:MAG: hypothetical protein RLT87_10280 [Gammaproteobacteria bacterium]
MKLILHIGMGKTGTSSIQKTLNHRKEDLASQNTQYLGMWFDILNPEYQGYLGMRQFMQSDETNMKAAGQRFVELLKVRADTQGIDTFILSNEALFANVQNITPFLRVVQQNVDLKIIAYIRDPHEWLPSAFTQWGLFHKQQKGPLKRFSELAPTLIGQYEGIRYWISDFRDVLTVRKHDTSINVVEDFAKVCGIKMERSDKRHLERSEPAETLLRAAFNAHFDNEVMPERFDKILLDRKTGVPHLDDLISLSFEYDGIEGIVKERQDLFEFIRDNCGEEFDFLVGNPNVKTMPDASELRQRLFDFMMEITISQSIRIKRLEKLVYELRSN